MARATQSTLLDQLRRELHSSVFMSCVRLRDGSPNMADASSPISVALAEGMVSRIPCRMGRGKVTPQGVGAAFAAATSHFLEKSFAALGHLRPGEWRFTTAASAAGLARFSQYEHIAKIQQVLNDHPDLKASLGGDYLVTPDIVVSRAPVSDSIINARDHIVGEGDRVARRSPLRAGNVPNDPHILLASISMKWSMRSDRAQNTRTEALNLIRNRKGKTPQIVVVTFEPLPSRLASIAMGTGDIDCTYHAALGELLETAREAKDATEQQEMLQMLVEGRRLRDISDLPLDLVS